MLNRRTIMQVAVLTIISSISAAGLAQSSDSVMSTTEQIRLAVSRSLPYLGSAGESWMNTKKCVSCHRVSFMTWSFDAAARNGFEVDQPKLQEWVRWSVSKSLDQPDKEKPVDGELNADGLSQLILAHPAGSSAALQDEARQEFVRLILKTQQDDGSWKPAGQLPSQKRPELETRQVSTMWNVLALRAAGQAPERRRLVESERNEREKEIRGGRNGNVLGHWLGDNRIAADFNSCEADLTTNIASSSIP